MVRFRYVVWMHNVHKLYTSTGAQCVIKLTIMREKRGKWKANSHIVGTIESKSQWQCRSHKHIRIRRTQNDTITRSFYRIGIHLLGKYLGTKRKKKNSVNKWQVKQAARWCQMIGMRCVNELHNTNWIRCPIWGEANHKITAIETFRRANVTKLFHWNRLT